MMNRNEFDSYIVGHVKEYLPPSFDNAEMELRTVTKANDVVLTGLSIRREEEQIIPNIYLEPFFDRYQAGESIVKIVGDIADVRIEADRSDKPIDIDILLNYDGIKDRLQIRLCDAEQNRERLKELVSVSDGDYAKTFQVCVGDMSADSYGTISVTPGLMNSWGIQVEQLNADAMAAEDHRGPRLYNLGDMMGHMMAGGEARNLLGNAFPVIPDENQINLYCLTMKDKTFGASLMAREDILAQAATVRGESFFILPSSVHEVLLMPESVAMSPQALVTMVQEINQNEVSPQDMLSDKVQYFDKDTGVRENALARQKRLELEKEKRPSVHEQLAEKKAEVKAKGALSVDMPRKSKIAEAAL